MSAQIQATPGDKETVVLPGVGGRPRLAAIVGAGGGKGPVSFSPRSVSARQVVFFFRGLVTPNDAPSRTRVTS